MAGAIAQDRESCQFRLCLTKNQLSYRAARPESHREAPERFLVAPLGRTQGERRRRSLSGMSVRDAWWLEGVPVGNLNFVETVKSGKRGTSSGDSVGIQNPKLVLRRRRIENPKL